MRSPHEAPQSSSFLITPAQHQGWQFMQRLNGRETTATDSAPQAPAAAKSQDDWPDLDQRVRAVGEW